jgi:hypothetical protein
MVECYARVGRLKNGVLITFNKSRNRLMTFRMRLMNERHQGTRGGVTHDSLGLTMMPAWIVALLSLAGSSWLVALFVSVLLKSRR